jgi:target of rapamycin complex subunit LST8
MCVRYKVFWRDEWLFLLLLSCLIFFVKLTTLKSHSTYFTSKRPYITGTVKLWDLRSPTYSRSFDCKAGVTSVALRPTCDEIVSGDQNGSVKLWDLSMGKCINNVVPGGFYCGAQKEAIQAVDSTDNLIVAASNHAHVYVWDPTESSQGGWKPITKFLAHAPGSYVLHASISPDGRHLVTTSSDHTVRLWDTSTWELSQTLQQHTKWVWDAAFCDDSSYLVTASSDHTARLWNLRTGEVVVNYTGHSSAVTCVALNDSSD